MRRIAASRKATRRPDTNPIGGVRVPWTQAWRRRASGCSRPSCHPITEDPFPGPGRRVRCDPRHPHAPPPEGRRGRCRQPHALPDAAARRFEPPVGSPIRRTGACGTLAVAPSGSKRSPHGRPRVIPPPPLAPVRSGPMVPARRLGRVRTAPTPAGGPPAVAGAMRARAARRARLPGPTRRPRIPPVARRRRSAGPSGPSATPRDTAQRRRRASRSPPGRWRRRPRVRSPPPRESRARRRRPGRAEGRGEAPAVPIAGRA